MDEQRKLTEALEALLDLAAASDGALTRDQVRDACKDIGLNEEQFDLICAYLESKKVKIQDFATPKKSLELFEDADEADEAGADKSKDGSGQRAAKNGRESAYYQMYLEELKSLRAYRDEEEEALVEAMLSGDQEAKERLIEGNLARVIRMSEEYLDQGVLAADLVQEGNMALVMAMETYDRQKNFRLHLLEEIEAAMVEAIREQTGADDVGRHLAQDANALMKATEELAEELEREATAEELAAYLHISQDKVEALVKMSLDAMNMYEG